MSQPSPADAVPPGGLPAQPAAVSALAPRERRIVSQLIALVAIPVVLGLILTGLRVSDATRSAQAYGQVTRLAALGQQVNGLAQAMEDERSGTAAFISDGHPAAGLPALRRQYAITDGWATRVRRLARQLGPGYPAQTVASAKTALASIAELPGLRGRAAQSQASAVAVTDGYSAAISGLFPVNDSIADLSGNSALIASVWAGYPGPSWPASRRTLAAQRSVIAYCRRRAGRPAAGCPSAMNVAVPDRSSSIACAKPLTCWPSAASRPTWL